MHRITKITASNVRTFDALELELHNLNVVIGANGCGKSTLIEIAELLRRATTSAFIEELFTIHGGPDLLLRNGSHSFEIGAEIDVGGTVLAYRLRLGPRGEILHERLTQLPPHELPTGVIFQRSANGELLFFNAETQQMASRQFSGGGDRTVISTALAGVGGATQLAAEALAAIEVHVAFDTVARWAANAQPGREPLARSAVKIAPIQRLQRFAANLPNAYQRLRNIGEKPWEYTLELVRLGIGDWVESVNVTPFGGGGAVALSLKPRGVDAEIPADSLSEGMLAYLAFVALARLPVARSLLAVDEPELHLHPVLATRVFDLLAQISETAPTLVATHSRRFLDHLEHPETSAILLDVDQGAGQTARVTRPDAVALDRWLSDYEGLGEVVDAGYAGAVFTESRS